jgi:diguanylate cyclase (GGDEF)-like protein
MTLKIGHRKIGVFTALITLLILLLIYSLFIQHDIALEQDHYGLIAEEEATHIITTIDCIMTRTNTLEVLIQDHMGETDFFSNAAANVYNSVLLETGVTLKNLAIAPGGIVSEVFPYIGNESLINFNFMDLSKPGNAEAYEAYEKGHTILTNPFELVQGGIGMAGRKPVIINDVDNGKKLWGLVTVTIDFDNLIKVLRLENLSAMGLNYELSYLNFDGSRHLIKSSGSLKKNAKRITFNIRNLTWELAVMPVQGWVSIRQIIIFAILFVSLSYFAGLFANLFLRLQESNRQLLQLSITDRLTGCYNRRAYEADFSNLQENPPDDNFVYFAADVNGLKATNDTLGHTAGDEIICGTADCLTEYFENYGKLYRTGGDEFACMIFIEKEALNEITANIKSIMDNWEGVKSKSLSFSIGYAEKREFPNASVKELAKIADKRMYENKRKFYIENGLDRRQSNRT